MKPETTKRLATYFAIAALVLAATAVLLALTGCATVPDENGEPVLVVAWPIDPETGGPDTTGWPLWAKIAAGFGTLLVAPRTRRNLVGAATAVARGEIKRAGTHLAAVTPFVGSPVEALPPKQREAVDESPIGAT